MMRTMYILSLQLSRRPLETREQAADGFVHEINRLPPLELRGVLDLGHGLAELLDRFQESHSHGLREGRERSVERYHGLIEDGNDVRPVLRLSRNVESEHPAEVGSVGVAGGEGRAKVPSIAQRPTSMAFLGSDDILFLEKEKTVLSKES